MKLTITHLIELIQEISMNVLYAYVNTKSKSPAELIEINPAETLVTIKRVTKDGTINISRVDSKKISAIADGLQENLPISIDTLLRNNDTMLELLLRLFLSGHRKYILIQVVCQS